MHSLKVVGDRGDCSAQIQSPLVVFDSVFVNSLVAKIQIEIIFRSVKTFQASHQPVEPVHSFAAGVRAAGLVGILRETEDIL